MMKQLLFVVPFATVCLGSTPEADAALLPGEFRMNASGCTYESGDRIFQTTQYGTANLSSVNDLTLFCNLGYGSASDVAGHKIKAWVRDFNATVDVQCTTMRVDTYGNVMYTGNQHTSGVTTAAGVPLVWSDVPYSSTAMFMKCVIPRTYNNSASMLSSVSGW